MPASHARPHLPGLFYARLSQSTNGGDQSSYKEKWEAASPGIGIPSCQYQEAQTFLLFYLHVLLDSICFVRFPPLHFVFFFVFLSKKNPVSLSLRHAPQKKKRKYISSSARNPSHTQRRLASFILYLSVSISILQTFIFFVFFLLFDCEFN